MSLALTDLLSPDVPVEGALRLALPLGNLARLKDVLLDPPGQIDVTLEICHRDDGLVVVEGRLDGQVRVACQRCLEPVQIPVERDIRLALAGSETGARAADGFESWSLEDGPMTIRALLEDELLLALPLVPVHEDPEACGELAERLAAMATDNTGASSDSPFAVLERLKR